MSLTTTERSLNDGAGWKAASKVAQGAKKIKRTEPLKQIFLLGAVLAPENNGSATPAAVAGGGG
jgi:hypothetical protein